MTRAATVRLVPFRLVRLASISLLALASSAAFSEAPPAVAKKADVGKGATVANTVCAACHAADGNSIGNAFPKLASQHEVYTHKQLVEFKPKDGGKAADRPNNVMSPIAAQLSDEDMRNVSAYYTGQKLKPSSARNKDTIDLGQKIYRGGIASKSIPACAGCHSPNGVGIPNQYPRLGGQFAEYTEAQLIAFRTGTRKNSLPMMQIASRLSDAEIKAVADYAAGLR